MMFNTLLAIETSGGACSVALLAPGQNYVRFELTQKAHTQLLLPMVQSLIEEANIALSDINAIAVGRGPGSFTGVRIAVSAAQGLAYGLNIPVYPVSTLAALRYQVNSQDANTIIMPAIDARMKEVYACVFNTHEQIVSECLVKPQDLLPTLLSENKPAKIIALGSGWDAYYDEIVKHVEGEIEFLPQKQVRALEIGLIAKQQMEQGVNGVLAKDLLPVYIRDEVAQKQI